MITNGGLNEAEKYPLDNQTLHGKTLPCKHNLEVSNFKIFPNYLLT